MMVVGWACLSLLRAEESVFYSEASRICGFDPVRVVDAASILAIGKIYEGLYQVAYHERPYRVEPCLAAALPSLSADGLTLTLPIRTAIRFQDDPCFTNSGGRGREATAEDFVYAFKRLADPANRSPGFGFFRGRLKGLDEFRTLMESDPAGGYDRSITGITALDRKTLRLELTRPWPQVLWVLSMHFTYVVPPEAVAYYGDNIIYHPVGTGPFRLTAWRPNYRMEFVRNPEWQREGRFEPHPADARKAQPLLDRIVQDVIGDPSTQWMLFLKGRLDVSGISRDQWDAVVSPEGELQPQFAKRGWRLYRAPATDIAYIGMNFDDPVLGTNRFLRQALTAAFDRDLWGKFFGARILPAAGPLPPDIEGYRPGRSGPPDLDQARNLLVLAGYPGGRDPTTGRRLQLSLDLGSTDPEVREAVELLVDFMARVGISIKPSYYNWPVFLARIERGDSQMFWLSWLADYPDPENFLQLFYGPNASPGVNRGNFRDPAYDRDYETMRVMPPGLERRKVIDRMMDRLQEESPWLFLHHRVNATVVQPWVTNWLPHDFPYGMFKYYGVDPQIRREKTP
jgi:ABC-type transport system substrate-binding protein